MRRQVIDCTRLRRGGLLAGVVLAGGVAGCGSDTTGPAARPLYWQLQLNHHAITLATVAPYDTIQLTATPLDVSGTPIATTARPVYTVVNDTNLTVDSTGLVRAHRVGSNAPNLITVVATLTVGGVSGGTLADTAVVSLVDWSGVETPPTLDSLPFRPAAGDSAARAETDTAGHIATQTFAWPMAKAGATAIANVVVHYASSDSSIAFFAIPNTTGAAVVTSNAPGMVLLTAEATVYGRRRVDSLWYTVGYPLRIVEDYGVGQFRKNVSAFDSTTAVNRLSVQTLTIGQGGEVLWGNSLVNQPGDDSLDVQFEDATNVAGLTTVTDFPRFGAFSGSLATISIPAGPGGNIPAFPAAPVTPLAKVFLQVLYDSVTSKARRFPVPGMYRWTSVHQGISGTVVVVANSALQPR